MNTKLRTLLAAVVALSLAVPGLASADRRGGDRYYGHYDRHGKHGYRDHYRDRPHYYRGRDRYITRYYRDNDDEDLLLGLVVGGILGYALPRYPDYYYRGRY